MNGSQKRTRSERVAALELPPGAVELAFDKLRSSGVLLRVFLWLFAVGVLWIVAGGWAPPFSFRKDYVPLRSIVARIAFQKADPQATQEARDRARRAVRYVYEQDAEPLVQMRAALQNRVVTAVGAKSYAELDQTVWQEFFPARATDGAPTREEMEAAFGRFKEAFPDQKSLETFESAVAEAMSLFERQGLMEKLPQEHNEGNQQEIAVHPKGDPTWPQVVKVVDVLIGEGDAIKQRLADRLTSAEAAARTFDWIRPRLAATLSFNKDETKAAIDAAVAQVGERFVSYAPGEVLAQGGQPLTSDALELLRLEYSALLASRSLVERVGYSLATMGMFAALSVLCGVYIYCYERKLLVDLHHFVLLLFVICMGVGLGCLAARDDWRAELIPLLLFGMTVAIAYQQELALLLSAAVTLAVVVATGQGMGAIVIMTAGSAAAIMLTGRIRSRRKLIYVGLAAGIVTMLTTIGVFTIAEQPLRETILPDATRFGLWCVITGFLMTGLLPFIESLFGVQTEISLLELGDVAHPLLQELVRRAPGTYNHSINVASLAEAAAEAIGARGLLVRVGAYFHDIGKMLKPGYFVENQGQDGNRHESLVPAMSTLIIIAHIKDGADLARQHRLPEPIIDFIQQHHGTTLVEYFFRRASERSEHDPNGAEVEESAFRYPGPKPQTREAGVLMLADAVESACRALVEPTPSRIEGVVRDLGMKRLLDGQFDESGLTLQELATIQESLIKSLTAVYHGRVKYPDQRTA